MKKRSILPIAVVMSLVLGATRAPASQPQLAPASQPQPAPASQPQFKLIAPELVRQGETFTGMVVEETPAGDQPVESGQVIFRGQVVPIQPGGKVTLPPFVKELGGTLVAAQFMRALGGSPTTLQLHHFAVVPITGKVPTHIAQASQLLNSGNVRITGEGLNAVQKAAVVRTDGTQLDVSNIIGSSLQLQGHIPGKIAPGTYRFVAWDAAGNRYEAPNQSRVATLQVQGDRITHRGQRGHISVLSDADGAVLLSGGEPQITLDQRIISVHAGQPAPVDFTAQQLGEYTVHAAIVDLEDLPTLPGARVVAIVAPISAVFDAGTQQTRATIAVHVVDDAGAPVAQAPINVAVAHPNGVDYANAVSNDQGRASLTETFAGDVAAAVISAYAYRVLGYAWVQDTACKCENLKVMMPKDAVRGGTLQGFEWSENPDKKKDPNAPAYFELASVVWQIQCSNEEKGGCEGSFKLSADTKGVSLEKFGQKEPKKEVELSYKCAGKCPGKGPTKVEPLTLYSTDKTITTTIKFKLHVECDKKKGDKTFEISVANPSEPAFRPESPANKAKREAEEKAREAFAEYIQELINEANRPPGEQPHEPEHFWDIGPELEPID